MRCSLPHWWLIDSCTLPIVGMLRVASVKIVPCRLSLRGPQLEERACRSLHCAARLQVWPVLEGPHLSTYKERTMKRLRDLQELPGLCCWSGSILLLIAQRKNLCLARRSIQVLGWLTAHKGGDPIARPFPGFNLAA